MYGIPNKGIYQPGLPPSSPFGLEDLFYFASSFLLPPFLSNCLATSFSIPKKDWVGQLCTYLNAWLSYVVIFGAGLLLTPSSWVLPSAQVEFNMQTELRESFECSDASRSSQGGFHFGVRHWWNFMVHFILGDGSTSMYHPYPNHNRQCWWLKSSNPSFIPIFVWLKSLLWFSITPQDNHSATSKPQVTTVVSLWTGSTPAPTRLVGSSCLRRRAQLVEVNWIPQERLRKGIIFITF